MSCFFPDPQVCLLNQVLSFCVSPEFKMMGKSRLEFMYHDLTHYVAMVQVPVVRAQCLTILLQKHFALRGTINWIHLIVPRSAKCFYSKMVKH